MDIVIAAAIGIAAGICSGMLGIGGGTIAVPMMVLLLAEQQHTAQGVALGAMLITALVGTIIHYRHGTINAKIAFWIAPGAVVFSWLGAEAADMVSAEWLTRVFAIMLLIIGGRMLLFNRGGQNAGARRTQPEN